MELLSTGPGIEWAQRARGIPRGRSMALAMPPKPLQKRLQINYSPQAIEGEQAIQARIYIYYAIYGYSYMMSPPRYRR